MVYKIFGYISHIGQKLEGFQIIVLEAEEKFYTYQIHYDTGEYDIIEISEDYKEAIVCSKAIIENKLFIKQGDAPLYLFFWDKYTPPILDTKDKLMEQLLKNIYRLHVYDEHIQHEVYNFLGMVKIYRNIYRTMLCDFNIALSEINYDIKRTSSLETTNYFKKHIKYLIENARLINESFYIDIEDFFYSNHKSTNISILNYTVDNSILHILLQEIAEDILLSKRSDIEIQVLILIFKYSHLSIESLHPLIKNKYLIMDEFEEFTLKTLYSWPNSFTFNEKEMLTLHNLCGYLAEGETGSPLLKNVSFEKYRYKEASEFNSHPGVTISEMGQIMKAVLNKNPCHV